MLTIVGDSSIIPDCDHGDAPMLAMEVAGIGTWCWDEATNSLTLSTMAQQLVHAVEGNLPYVDFLMRVHPDDRSGMNSTCRRAATRRRSCIDATPGGFDLDQGGRMQAGARCAVFKRQEVAMRVDEVMTTTVATVRADAAIGAAIATMEARHVSGLPVLDGAGALVGILTEGDLLRRVETGTAGHPRSGWLDVVLGAGRGASEYVHTHSRYVEDLMSRELVTATESTSLEDVVALMAKRHVKRLPIVRGDALVGVVSRADLVRALGRALKAEATGGCADGLIHERLQADLRRQSWFPAGGVAFTVRRGVVTFKGAFSNQQVRDALRVTAQNIPGVTAVEDEMVWVDPVVGVVY